MHVVIQEVEGVNAVVVEAFEIAGVTGIVTFDVIAEALAGADAALSLNSQIIGDVADPVANQDVATKAYVDANSGGGGGTRVEMTASASLSASNRDTCYTNAGASSTVVATLPTSAAIGSSRWRARFIVVEGQVLRFLRQGTNTINYFGVSGISLESANAGDTIDIEYAGGGVFVVTGATGQGWSFP